MAFLKSFEVIQRFKQFLSTRRAFLKFCENVHRFHGVDIHAYFRNYRDLYNQYYNGRKAPFEEFWAELVNLGFEYPETPEGKYYWAVLSQEWRRYLHGMIHDQARNTPINS